MEVIVSLAQRVVVFHQGREIARGTPREVTSNPARDRGLSRPPQGAAAGRTHERAAARGRASGGALRRPDRRRRRLARGAAGLGRGAAGLQRRRQDHDAQRHRRHRAASPRAASSFDGENIAGQPAYAIVRKGLALSPEGWRLFAQQSVENNLLLGATPLADRSAHPAPARARLRGVPAAGRAARASAPAPCRAASARCWRSAAR